MPALIAFFFAALFGGYSTMNVAQQDALKTDRTAQSQAAYAMSYKTALVACLKVGSTLCPQSGSRLNEQALSAYLPSGLAASSVKGDWAHVVAGEQLFVYFVGPASASGVLESLYQNTGKSQTVGHSNGSSLISARGVNTGITVPASIPVGAVVIYGK